MLQLFRLIFIAFLCFSHSSCKNDSPIECTHIDNIGSEVKINSEKLLLHKAEVREDATPTLDTYEFLIEAISSDCNQLLKFRFYASVPNNELLEGELNVIETSVFTADHITSFSYTEETLEPVNFHTLFGIGGKAAITSHAENEYSIQIDALLSEEEELNFNLRYQF